MANTPGVWQILHLSKLSGVLFQILLMKFFSGVLHFKTPKFWPGDRAQNHFWGFYSTHPTKMLFGFGGNRPAILTKTLEQCNGPNHLLQLKVNIMKKKYLNCKWGHWVLNDLIIFWKYSLYNRTIGVDDHALNGKYQPLVPMIVIIEKINTPTF